MDLSLLYNEGRVGGTKGVKSAFFSVPNVYLPYLPPFLRNSGDDPVICGPVVDKEGMVYLVVGNGEHSKFRKCQFDALQAFTNLVWKQGRTDVFELPIACMIDYLCFKVLAVPLQLWLEGEELPTPVIPPVLEDATILSNSEFSMYKNNQKIFISSPLVSLPILPTYRQFTHLLNTMELPEITNPVVFRSILKRFSIPVSHLGEVLAQVELPVLKHLIVGEMISRANKWAIRGQLWSQWRNGEKMHVEKTSRTKLIQLASNYFKVSTFELETFYVEPDPFRSKWIDEIDFLAPENRLLFPHFQFFLKNPLPSVPSVRFVCPRPVPSPPESLSVEYACGVFRLEMAVASGDVLESIVVIGDLVNVLLKMIKQNPESLNLGGRVLSLCEAARSLVPLCLPVPSNLVHAVLQVGSPSELAYQAFRQEYLGDSLATLCLDNQMARSLFAAGKAKDALVLLNSVVDRAEKLLGARHSLTVAIWIRKAQAIKKILELDGTNQEEFIQQGIKCLNKAMRSAEMSSESPVVSDLLDPSSFSHHLLSLFHMWNGEPAKAVRISKSGLVRLETHFGRAHPRFLNSAFLHAKLLEGFCASSMSTDSAREAISILEDILESLIDLADDDGAISADFNEFSLPETDMMSAGTEMKRKLAVTSLILKLNVWLLDPGTASDLMDFVVADKLSGTRGVAILPRKSAVKETVCGMLEDRRAALEPHFFPILDLSTSLPDPVLTCCHMALDAKSKGTRVSDWFKSFHQSTVRTIGGADLSPNRDLLVNLFLTFVFINDNGFVFAGPLSSPLVPRPPKVEQEYPSKGVIYREWEQSAALYCIDHEFYN